MTERKGSTPIKSIRLKCLDCSGHQYNEVSFCGELACPLWPYRMGRRPTAEDLAAHLKAADAREWKNMQMKKEGDG